MQRSLKRSFGYAWNDRLSAERHAYPPTLVSFLWILAKSRFTKNVAPFVNLSTATREFKNLQRFMREVKMGRRGKSQLYYYCVEGMTSSVVRIFEMRSIKVEMSRAWIDMSYDCCIL